MKVLEDLIYPVVDEVRETIESGHQLEKSPKTPLFGSGSALDSIGLVTFIVAVEARIEKETGKAVTLADEKAMSLKNSPFQNLATLAAYIEKLLREAKDA